ncbi:unnamed protein product [Clonostachys byssicola]|uniref:DUF7704 domain-containing protein n=1 Tax=Clonostachys byssicola TaxID=160290 RepID=A0A9N9UM66_9HYPO|nr:unnamed protein product [Clonostachys byssicola]
MAALLPPIPRVIFSILEPISLVAGFLGAVVDPSWFMAQQIPQTQTVPTTEGAVIVTMQLGNLYLLMAFMGLFILNTTSEAKVVRAYLLALWLGDIGHVGLSLYGLGWEKAMSISDWNATTIGNVPVTIFLFLMRSSYFLGLFGPDRPLVSGSKKKV